MRILLGEETHFLWPALFRDVKRIGWQPADESAFVIRHSHI